jgi:hypothetical protein
VNDNRSKDKQCVFFTEEIHRNPALHEFFIEKTREMYHFESNLKEQQKTSYLSFYLVVLIFRNFVAEKQLRALQAKSEQDQNTIDELRASLEAL